MDTTTTSTIHCTTRNRRTRRSAVAALIVAGIASTTFIPAADAAKLPVGKRPVGVALPNVPTTLPPPPQYKVKAHYFIALDETGPDSCYVGFLDNPIVDLDCSDEPYWVISSPTASGGATTSAYDFSDVDSGESRGFGPDEGCITASCAGVALPRGIAFGVQLWEADEGDIAETLAKTESSLKDAHTTLRDNDIPGAAIANGLAKVSGYLAGVLQDDHIATQGITYDANALAALTPFVGSIFDDRRFFSDGDGSYLLVVRIERTR